MNPETEQRTTAESGQEESIFDTSELDTRGYDKHTRNARIALYVLAAFQLLALFVVSTIPDADTRNITIAVSLIFTLFFVGCALFSYKKPMIALTTAAVVYGALLLFQLIANPASIISIRLLVQGGLMVFLIRGVQNARELERVKRNFGH